MSTGPTTLFTSESLGLRKCLADRRHSINTHGMKQGGFEEPCRGTMGERDRIREVGV